MWVMAHMLNNELFIMAHMLNNELFIVTHNVKQLTYHDTFVKD